MTPSLPYLDPALPVAERVDDLLARMTLPEKVGQMLQLNARRPRRPRGRRMHGARSCTPRPRRWSGRSTSPRGPGCGIPLLIAEDCIHGHSFWAGATIFPTQLGMACTWDAELVERVARATAVEVAATGIHWTFSPVLCIARDLRWGRVSETFGEDPFLIGELASAMVRGYQGDGPGRPDRDPGLRQALRRATPRPRAAGTPARPTSPAASCARGSCRRSSGWPGRAVATFMLGYQAMDGVPITVNRWLLNDVLQGEWGYTGHARHRLGQRRAHGVGAEGLRRLRAGLGGGRPRRQRHGHDHAPVLRRRAGGGRRGACSTRPRSTRRSGAS